MTRRTLAVRHGRADHPHLQADHPGKDRPETPGQNTTLPRPGTCNSTPWMTQLTRVKLIAMTPRRNRTCAADHPARETPCCPCHCPDIARGHRGQVVTGRQTRRIAGFGWHGADLPCVEMLNNNEAVTSFRVVRRAKPISFHGGIACIRKMICHAAETLSRLALLATVAVTVQPPAQAADPQTVRRPRSKKTGDGAIDGAIHDSSTLVFAEGHGAGRPVRAGHAGAGRCGPAANRAA